MTAPALIFLAAPSPAENHSDGHPADDYYADDYADDDAHDDGADHPGTEAGRAADRAASRRAGKRPRAGSRSAGTALRMTRGARTAAAGMKVGDVDIQRCIDAPDDASPDPTTPERTRFRRGDLTVVAAADGMVLRVSRRGR